LIGALDRSRLPGRAIRNLLSRQLAGRGWSDHDLARATGLSRLRVNRLKSRRARPTVHDALLISAALGLRIAQLFSLAVAPDVGSSVECDRGAES
jgi:transcriptional regulator with XRE-family HTH domain